MPQDSKNSAMLCLPMQTVHGFGCNIELTFSRRQNCSSTSCANSSASETVSNMRTKGSVTTSATMHATMTMAACSLRVCAFFPSVLQSAKVAIHAATPMFTTMQQNWMIQVAPLRIRITSVCSSSTSWVRWAASLKGLPFIATSRKACFFKSPMFFRYDSIMPPPKYSMTPPKMLYFDLKNRKALPIVRSNGRTIPMASPPRTQVPK
mmetsp:Transcript_30945/g.46689  ORF Transcript_30945/g.46689 Transcript_30945/m.46689 type:complete len:207 (-) Transcript_30945:116-736(-)